MATFGNNFIPGNLRSHTVEIVVQANLTVQIVVAQLGQKTNEIGFIVTSENETIIYQRNSGATFD